VNLDYESKLRLAKEMISKYIPRYKYIRYNKKKKKNKKWNSCYSFLYWQLNHEKFLHFDGEFLLNESGRFFSISECYLDRDGSLSKWKRVLPVIYQYRVRNSP
jgi:hypothetical protein